MNIGERTLEGVVEFFFLSFQMRVHTIRLWALGSLNQLFSKASTSAVKIPGFFFLRAKTALIEKDQMHVIS